MSDPAESRTVELAENTSGELDGRERDTRLRLAQRGLTVVALLFLLLTAFRSGWTRSATDFPNYYTAAVLVRKGEPLRRYFDWTWFARQMNLAGFEGQIGGYTQTPLTMLPLVPVSRFPPQTAKQIWLALNLALLGVTVWLLSSATSLSMELVSLLAFCGFFSLRPNFVYGQYYIFLLFLLALGYFLLCRNRSIAAGCVIATAFALKLYGGPILLFFAASRNRKAATAMLAATLGLCALAVALFGWNDVKFYGTEVLVRSLAGGSINPYDAMNPTLSTLFHQLFLREPELNPRPLLDAPGVLFFLTTFVSLAVLGLVTLGVALRRDPNLSRGYALFVVATLVLSTNVGSYTYILALVPITLLWRDCTTFDRLTLLILYMLVTAPVPSTSLFPKVWLLLAMFLYVGRPFWRTLPKRAILVLLGLAAALALLDAQHHLRAYGQEPGRHFEPVATQEGAVFSGFPVVLRSGLVFQSISGDRYVLCWLHDGRHENFAFDGQALHPRLSIHDGEVIFDLVQEGKSVTMALDPVHSAVRPALGSDALDAAQAATSPDGKWIASVSTTNGWDQIWVRAAAEGTAKQLTAGACNNSAPAWELDSQALIFASDCDRAFAMPALYRAPIPLRPSGGPLRSQRPGLAPAETNSRRHATAESRSLY